MSELKLKKQEYQSLINDYREYKDKIKTVVERKKQLGQEIAALKKITDISKLATNLEKEQNKSHK